MDQAFLSVTRPQTMDFNEILGFRVSLTGNREKLMVYVAAKRF